MNLGSSSGASWSSAGAGDGAGDQFPAGLRVLVVDDDPTCLMILEKMLKNCSYEVTKCNRAEVALSLLRENKSGYDVVISDVHMPDMDGFKLLVHIGLEMDLPVIMMSADDSKNVVMKGITHGACDYLIKPVRMEALRNIWQHVVRKRKQEREDIEPSVSLDEAEKKPPEEDLDSANEGQNGKNAKKRKDEEDEDEEKEHSSSKKPRLVWSMDLHQQFVAAVNQLGYDKAVPKKILDLMNVPGVTRENVASHLQKYRNYLKKLPHQPSGINPPFMGNLDAGYGSLNQLPSVSAPLIDQRNIFSFENPNLRYGQVQTRQGHNGNITKHINLLHGIPTTMQPNQITGFSQSFTGMNSQGLIPLTNQSQSHVSRHPVLANGLVGNGNNFPHRGNSGIPPIGSTTTLQRDGNMENVQNRSQNRGFQGVDLTPNSFRDSNNMQGGLNVGGSKVIVSSAEGSWTHITDNSLPVNQPFGTEEYNPEDLLTPFLTQQENEFGFDWCSSENFPV